MFFELASISRLVLLCSALHLVICDVIEPVEYSSNCPMLDLKYVVDTLLQQQRELCYYQCHSNGTDERFTALKNQIEAISSILFHPALFYNSKKYVISKFPYKSSQEAMTYCNAFGGYLAEVDDKNEYTALQNFVFNTPDVDIVLIAGSDAITEGIWKFQRTGALVPILDWCPGQPDNLGDEDCLNLWKQFGSKMNDLPCGFRSAGDRFMCELPQIYQVK